MSPTYLKPSHNRLGVSLNNGVKRCHLPTSDLHILNCHLHVWWAWGRQKHGVAIKSLLRFSEEPFKTIEQMEENGLHSSDALFMEETFLKSQTLQFFCLAPAKVHSESWFASPLDASRSVWLLPASPPGGASSVFPKSLELRCPFGKAVLPSVISSPTSTTCSA